jgi:two-component sensor histidine kinase
MTWVESGGPKAEQPSRRGFGSLVVSTMVERSLQGEVELVYALEGLRWRVRCPADQGLEVGHVIS